MTTPELAPGTIIDDRYVVVHRVDAGAGRLVCAVRRSVDDQLYSLELLPPELAEGDHGRERFAREASLLRQLEGPHVSRVLDAGIHETAPWLVTAARDHAPHLGQLCGRRILSHVQTSLLLEQIGSALHCARAVGLVHGDLSPERVCLVAGRRRYGAAVVTAKVHGFGLARLVAGAGLDPPAVTPSNMLRWRWIAPERMNGHAELTPAVDVWALGLLAFQMVTGQHYWRGETSAQVKAEVLFAPLPAASERAGRAGGPLPGGFDAWFARCVARDPEARFPDGKRAAYAFDAASQLTRQGDLYDDEIRVADWPPS